MVKKAFTLVEILIVMAILLVLAMIMIGTINPMAMVGKAHDATRKKDIGRIRVAFEEYFSDKGCYPAQGIIDELRSVSNCRTEVFKPWLNSWSCDPLGQPYIIVVDWNNGDCPKWFKILVNLENEEDPDVPDGWYQRGDDFFVLGYGINEVNYGTSSTNVNWDDYALDPSCMWFENNHGMDECYVRSVGGGCSGALNNRCSGDNCYARNDCGRTDVCKVSCCGLDCI